jgi:hypothetical protein
MTFLDRDRPPDDASAAALIGALAPVFTALRARLAARHAPVTETWSWSGKAYGWTLALKRKKRAVVYLTPCAGWFRASLALSEDAVVAARTAGLPADVLDLIEGAQRFPEGRAVRIEVRDAATVDVVERLVALRMGS